jgi:general stress protein 26
MDICNKYVELHDKIKNIKIAMMTVIDEKGTMRSVPMTTMQTECEGNVWFFTSSDSEKVDEIRKNPHVNLSYANHDKEIYVSVSGIAEVVRDKQKMETLWKPVLEEWFPGGLENNELTLLKVEMQQAEYWDGKSMVQIWDTTAAVKVEE